MTVQNQSTARALTIVVVLLSLILTLPWLDRPFYSRGEPREALVAQSMLVTGNWISPPAYNGAVPSKPPFSHWLIALTSLVGGEVSESTARVPSALAFVIFNVCFFRFLLKRVPTDTAICAIMILLSAAEWFRAGVSCRVDTILSTSLAGGLLALYSWREAGRRKFPLIAAALISCAALTKGPIGIALPLGIFSLYEFIEGEKTARNALAIAARGTVIALPIMLIVSMWYVAGYLQRGDAFLDKIWYENVSRLTSSMEDEPHKHSALYLIVMLLLGFLPWTLAWACALRRQLPHVRVWRGLLSDWWRTRSQIQRFASIAAGGIFLFFCIPSSKRGVYLLPAYPFIALIAAQAVRDWRERARGCMAVASKTLWVCSVALACASIVVLLLPCTTELKNFSGAFFGSISLTRLIGTLGLGAMLFKLVRLPILKDSIARLALSMVGAVVAVSFFVAEPILYQLSPKAWLSSNEFLSAVNLSKREKVYSFGSEAYAASFYLKKPFFSVTARPESGALVFVEQRNLERLRREIASDVHEVARFSSGLESEKRTLVVVEVPYDDHK